MIEKENAKIIEKVYEQIKEGDVESLSNPFAADVIWQLPEMENVPFAGIWHGTEGVRQFFAKVFELQGRT